MLIIAGRWDPVYSVARSEQIAALMPRAELHVFEYSGHMPLWEQPDHFRRTVTDWVKRHELAATGTPQ